MATYTADAGEIGVYGRTLAAGVEDIVNIANKAFRAEVRYWPGSGTEPIYALVNSGTAAAAPSGDGGSPCVEILPGESVKLDTFGPTTQVRLYSAGTAKYSVNEA